MFLEKIAAIKREELKQRKSARKEAQMKEEVRRLPPPRDFLGAIVKSPSLALIAEVKQASPSAGVIRKAVDLGGIAREYEAAGAAAVSVLTEGRFFAGQLGHLGEVRGQTSLPLLQKDFIIDPFQIYEGRLAGADAVLLISVLLEREQIGEFAGLAGDLGMAALVEVHGDEDLEKISVLRPPLIGINNRDLHTLKVTLETTLKLIGKVPQGAAVVSESGIHSRKDVETVQRAGVKGILVGEALMRAADPAAKIRELLETDSPQRPQRTQRDNG